MPVFTVTLQGEDETLRYVADAAPEVGEEIEASGVLVVVENVLLSVNPEGDAALIEARRSDPAE